MYNMQSGLKRKTFKLEGNAASGTETASKDRVVTGLATDALNRSVIASTLDGTVNVMFCLSNLRARLTLIY